MSKLLKFILLAFASWRLTSLVSMEDGPWDMFAKFRNFIGVRYDEYSQPTVFKNTFAKGIVCVWCASMWVAFAAAFISPYKPHHRRVPSFIINWLSISALIIGTDEAINLIARGARK